MPIIANAFPDDFEPGSDFIQIEDEEFDLASEPQGMIAIATANDQGYLTLEAAKRLLVALTKAIANSEAPRPHFDDDENCFAYDKEGRSIGIVGSIGPTDSPGVPLTDQLKEGIMTDNPLMTTLNPESSEYWCISPALRYRLIASHPTRTLVLEQKWQGSNGGERWEAVPTVNEDGSPLLEERQTLPAQEPAHSPTHAE